MQDKDEYIGSLLSQIAELKAENVEIKTSYINFIAKLKREMITKDDIQDLKNTAKKFVEERNSLRFENERLRFCLDAQRINETKQYNEKVNFERKNYKLKQTLQEIKAIAESAMAKQQEYKKDFEQIIDLITKAEEE